MGAPDSHLRVKEEAADKADTVKRAFKEFLTLPTLIIIGFLLLALASYSLDRARLAWLEPVREFLKLHVFADPRATSDLLRAVASGIIAVTSITITLLLIVVQQSATTMTAQVFDQFLRRRINQIYFGFFVGLALYSLVTLATVNEPFNPVYGGTLVFILTVAALYLLVLLLYTTINQMRPAEIIETIHDHILVSRERSLELIRKTRRESAKRGHEGIPVKSEKRGYVTRIDVDRIGAVAAGGKAEVILLVSIGSYVAFQDSIAIVIAESRDDAERIAAAVRNGIRLERLRDIDLDPAYGIEQLEMIAWTSISTSKSNPEPGLLTIHSLRDVMARWSLEESTEPDAEPLPVVYTDKVFARLLDAFETFAVVSSESLQHQNYIEVVRTFTIMFDRLPPQAQKRAEDLILRILSVLGDHVLTAELDEALSGLVVTLKSSKKDATAHAVEVAQQKLSLSVGRLNSRATRATVKE